MNIFKLTVIFLNIIVFIFFVNIWKNIKSYYLNKIIKENSEKITDRQYWVDLMYKISFPLLYSLSKGELKKLMPVEKNEKAKGNEHFTYLEALGRLLCGISPWLESKESSRRENKIKEKLKILIMKSIHNAVNPLSPDYMTFSGKYGKQPLVDAAFLAQAFIRSPKILWGELNKETKKMIISEMRKTRKISPYQSNWLMFTAMIETFFLNIGEQYNEKPIYYALNEHEKWYKGDGIYGDGPEFHWDYYNSYVIQPMILDISQIMLKKKMKNINFEKYLNRSKRYACILERLISPEGTYPPIGRSLAYRMGAFHLLSQISLMKKLPKNISPAQVRCALTAVIKKQMSTFGTFDNNGWLKIGFNGHQMNIGEMYISTGSLYLCSVIFLPLGLPETDEFWNSPKELWTQKKAWQGKEFPIDSNL